MINGDYKCCICNEISSGWGNNPEPVRSTHRNIYEEIRTVDGDPLLCCDGCFSNFVIPARRKVVGGRGWEELN